MVKRAILQAYEPVPEVHRDGFRTLKRPEGPAYVEYSKEKKRLFDKWGRFREVDTFEGLKNLILLKDFRDIFPDRLEYM